MAHSNVNGFRRGSRYHRLDDIPTDKFTPKTYQIQLLDAALRRNTLLCLGCSQSKVFLALMVAKELSSCTRGSLSQKHKVTFYLTDSEDEVEALYQTLPHHTDLHIGCYPNDLENAGLNTENMLTPEWSDFITSYHLLIFHAPVFLLAVQNNILNLSDVNLLIFDECHRSVEVDNHPYAQIVALVKMLPHKEQPHILGVTAAIAGTECGNPARLQETITSMEDTMHAYAETSMLILSERFGCRPKENIIKCISYELSDEEISLNASLKDLLEENYYFFSNCCISVGPDTDNRDPTEIPLQVLSQCVNVLDVLGAWCTASISEYFIMQLEKIVKCEKNDIHKRFLRCVITNLRYLTKVFEINFHPNYDVDELLEYTTPKVRELVAVLRNYKPQLDFIIVNNDGSYGEDFSDLSDAEDDDSSMSGSDGGGDDENGENVQSSNKMSKPVHIAVKRTADGGHEQILSFSEEDEKNLCGVVFVENRYIAFGLNKMIEEICSWDENLCFVKSCYITGQGVRSSHGKQKVTRTFKRQEEALRKFRTQECNLVIATQELEEGVDIPKCNLVVRFDSPKDYRSYTLSKGRARARDAAFVILVDENNYEEFQTNLRVFKGIEQVLLGERARKLIILNKTDEDFDEGIDSEDNEDDCEGQNTLPPYYTMPGCSNSPQVTMENSIALINRYCAKLPSDAFTHLTPQCRLEKMTGAFTKYVAYLRLPINSPIKEELKGPPMSTKQLAKKAVALKMCEQLHQKGELDENLVPVGKEMFLYEEEEEWAEEEDLTGQARPGTTKRKQYYVKKVADGLLQSQPVAGQICYLYLINLHLTGPITDEQNTRGRLIYAPEDTVQTLGFLLSRQVSQVPNFPVYTRSGEVTVSVDLLQSNLIFSSNEISKLLKFHHFIFTGVLHLEKDPMEFNPERAESGLIVVPLNGSNHLEIEWSFVDKVIHFLDTKKPAGFSKRSPDQPFEFNLDDFKDAVVMPSYRNIDQPQHFYVAEILHDLNPTSPFPSPELYKTFQDYYTSKYGLVITNTRQPLLDVDHTSARLNLLTPRYMNQKGVALPTSSAETKRARRENLQQKQILVPELCDVHVFPASLWRKTVCLPAVLYRVNNLLLAEELRTNISRETGIGLELLPEGFTFPQLDFGFETSPEKLKEAEMNVKLNLEKLQEEQDKIKYNSDIKSEHCIVDQHNVGHNVDNFIQSDSSKDTLEEKATEESVCLKPDEKINMLSSMNGSSKLSANSRRLASISASLDCSKMNHSIKTCLNENFIEALPEDCLELKENCIHKNCIVDKYDQVACSKWPCNPNIVNTSSSLAVHSRSSINRSDDRILCCDQAEMHEKAQQVCHLHDVDSETLKTPTVTKVIKQESSLNVSINCDKQIIDDNSCSSLVEHSIVQPGVSEDLTFVVPGTTSKNSCVPGSIWGCELSNLPTVGDNVVLTSSETGFSSLISETGISPLISLQITSCVCDQQLSDSHSPKCSETLCNSRWLDPAPTCSSAGSGLDSCNPCCSGQLTTSCLSSCTKEQPHPQSSSPPTSTVISSHHASHIYTSPAAASSLCSQSSLAAEPGNDRGGGVPSPSHDPGSTIHSKVSTSSEGGLHCSNVSYLVASTSGPTGAHTNAAILMPCSTTFISASSKSPPLSSPDHKLTQVHDCNFETKVGLGVSHHQNKQKILSPVSVLEHQTTCRSWCKDTSQAKCELLSEVTDDPRASESCQQTQATHSQLSEPLPPPNIGCENTAIIMNTLGQELSDLDIDLLVPGISGTFHSSDSAWASCDADSYNAHPASAGGHIFDENRASKTSEEGLKETTESEQTSQGLGLHDLTDLDVIKFSFATDSLDDERKKGEFTIDTWLPEPKKNEDGETAKLNESCNNNSEQIEISTQPLCSKKSSTDEVSGKPPAHEYSDDQTADFDIGVWGRSNDVPSKPHRVPGRMAEMSINLGSSQTEESRGLAAESQCLSLGVQQVSLDEDRDLSTFCGPSPCLIMQALTMSNANDFFSLERLETIGDSFLKYAITVYLYCSYPGIHEGKLSYLRSKQVSNYNLYRLGRRKNLAEYMVSTKFEPYENWLPPGYVINEDRRRGPVPKVTVVPSLGSKVPSGSRSFYLDDCADSAATNESVEFQQELQWIQQSQEADQLDDLADSGGVSAVPYSLQRHHGLPDKSVADCVEALIGCFLTTCGRKAALMFMSWLGLKVLPKKSKQPAGEKQCRERTSGTVRPFKVSEQEFDQLRCPASPMFCPSPHNLARLDHLLEGFSALEDKINYRFRDRSYLLQAFTHASYHYNTITDCYQRIEFLGDAILDYVITRHLYEDSKKYSPGILTDLRSALVNNNIFAALAVKWGFHKYFKAISPSLFQVIDKFVKRQKDKNQDDIDIDEEYRALSMEDLEREETNEEDDEDEEEEVEMEIPKALGDIFESVAGAIYLDSGMSLDTVWRVYYRLMKPHIEKYLKSIPKSPVRELLEAEPETAKFERPERTLNGKVRVTVNVVGKGVYSGIGRNYRIAKSAAAKKALRSIRIQSEMS